MLFIEIKLKKIKINIQKNLTIWNNDNICIHTIFLIKVFLFLPKHFFIKSISFK